MFWDPDQARVRDELLARIRDLSEPNLAVMIDGPSGAGKTSLAGYLTQTVLPNAQIIHMDSIYPGWDGLDTAIEILIRDVLPPVQRGGVGKWQLWDWAKNAPTQWQIVRGNTPLIVEGCGSLARGTLQFSNIRVWLDADDNVRKSRALSRDGIGFEEHWDQWQNSFDHYVERESPRESADITLNVTGWPLNEHQEDEFRQ